MFVHSTAIHAPAKTGAPVSSLLFLQQLHLHHPWWLFLALQPAALWIWCSLRVTKRLSAYAAPALQPWVIVREQRTWRSRLFSRASAYSLAWVLFAIAAAGPRLPLPQPQGVSPDAMNIMVVMDVSRSMLSNDVQPNRLRRAALELDELLSRAQGQRLGVIVFAARPHIYVPLTWDTTALRYYLQSLDKLVLPTRGSQLTAALTLAKDQLQKQTRPGAIVLFSDGDFSSADTTQQLAMLQISQQLQQQHLPLYILGIGSNEGGPIPLKNGGWLSNNGKPVISRLHESLLQQLADTSGGRYARVSDDDADWHSLFDKGLLQQLPLQKSDDERLWSELYPWVLFPGLLLFFVAVMPLCIPRKASMNAAAMIMSLGVIIGMLGSQKVSAAEDDWQRDALQSYQQQHYDQAVKLYAHVAGYNGRFGAGAAYYRKSDYLSAQRQFAEAILMADSDKQRADALFNLGNSYFQRGDYHSAMRSFADVLRYQSNYPAARNNLALSSDLNRRVITALEDEQGNRAGRGPRSTRAPEGLNLNQNLAASIDSSKENKHVIIPSLPDNRQALITKGLEFARLAALAKTQQPTQKQQQELAEARLYMLQIEEQPEILWQSLFEREEGFGAPQQEPNVLPGVKPW